MEKSNHRKGPVSLSHHVKSDLQSKDNELKFQMSLYLLAKTLTCIRKTQEQGLNQGQSHVRPPLLRTLSYSRSTKVRIESNALQSTTHSSTLQHPGRGLNPRRQFQSWHASPELRERLQRTPEIHLVRWKSQERTENDKSNTRARTYYVPRIKLLFHVLNFTMMTD